MMHVTDALLVSVFVYVAAFAVAAAGASGCGTPMAATLISPAPDAVFTVGANPTLEWKALTAEEFGFPCSGYPTNSYKLIYKEPSTLISELGWDVMTAFMITTHSSVQTGVWNWWVKTTNSGSDASSAVTEVRRFCVATPPTRPTLVNPQSNQTINLLAPLPVTLVWAAPSWGTQCWFTPSYSVEVSTDGGATYSKLTVGPTATNTTWTFTTDTEVIWRVAANNALSSVSTAGSFRVCIARPPEVPQLAGFSVANNFVTLTWNQVTDWGSTCNVSLLEITLSIQPKGGAWSAFALPATETSFRFLSTVEGSFNWLVTASNGVLSYSSATSTFSVLPKCLIVPNTTVTPTTANSTTLRLSWVPMATNCSSSQTLSFDVIVWRCNGVSFQQCHAIFANATVYGMASGVVVNLPFGQYKWSARMRTGVYAGEWSPLRELEVTEGTSRISSGNGNIASSSHPQGTSATVVIKFDPKDANGVTTNQLANEIATAIGVSVQLVTVTFVSNGEILVTISGADAIAKADELVQVIRNKDGSAVKGTILRKAIDAYVRNGSTLTPTSTATRVSAIGILAIIAVNP